MQYDHLISTVVTVAAVAGFVALVGYYLHGWITGDTSNTRIWNDRLTVGMTLISLALVMLSSAFMFFNGMEASGRTWLFSWVAWFVTWCLAHGIDTRVFKRP